MTPWTPGIKGDRVSIRLMYPHYFPRVGKCDCLRAGSKISMTRSMKLFPSLSVHTLPVLALLAILPLTQSLRADDDTALEGQMKILARSMRQLSSQVSDPGKQQENISLLETMKKAATDSKSLEPSMTRTIPDGKRASFLADYRTDLDELRDALDQVEQAIKAGDCPKAQSLLGKVATVKKEAHGKFKRD